jgi:hypothetical protein
MSNAAVVIEVSNEKIEKEFEQEDDCVDSKEKSNDTWGCETIVLIWLLRLGHEARLVECFRNTAPGFLEDIERWDTQ